MLLGMKWKEFAANNPFKGQQAAPAAPVVVSVKTPPASPGSAKGKYILNRILKNSWGNFCATNNK